LFATLVHRIYAVSVGGGEVLAIGASGAISGVLGAYLIIFSFITTLRIPAVAFIPFWFILQILYVDSGGVAYLAHMGGFIAGVGTGYAWGKKLLSIPNMRKTLIHTQKIENANPLPEPEVIESADFYGSGSRKYQLFVKLPDSATNPSVESIYYLNEIARISLRK
jgi:Rhomboid family